MSSNGTTRIRNPFPTSGAVQPKPGTGPVNENQSPNFNNGLKPLTPQQLLFVSYYIVNFKSSDAAEKAGYVRSYGAQLMQLPNVQEAIRREINKRNRRVQITQDRVLEEVALVAYGNVADFFEDFGKGRSLIIKPKGDLSPEQQRLMSSISESITGKQRTLRFKAHDKMRALNLLMQYMGLLDGQGKQIDPAGMAARLRAAAARAEDTLPIPADDAEYGDYSEDGLITPGQEEDYTND